MSRYLIIINFRTLFSLLLSLLVPFIAYEFKVVYNIDLTLMSIAIIFPLVFTIRGAFRRREKALEHLSRFRASLITVENFFQNSKMPQELKTESTEKLEELNSALFEHLNTKSEDTTLYDQKLQEMKGFILVNREAMSGGTRDKLYRFLRDVIDSADNLIGIHSHRTPVSLKAYCLIFIYIFPVVYTPTIINKIGLENPNWLTYFIVILSEFILISLYNIQDQMEYPFDDKGLDDIKFKLFKFKR